MNEKIILIGFAAIAFSSFLYFYFGSYFRDIIKELKRLNDFFESYKR